MVLVGFSFSFVWTVCVLFLEGLLNGTIVVAKTYLYEICPPEYHSLAFSLVWVPNNVALFVGPTLGGFLACPATRFQTFDIPIFRQFPYLLPCAVVACLQFCILIVGCILLTESRGKTPKDEYIDLSEVSAEDDDEKRPKESIMGILRDRLVLIPCALYAVYALASICTNYTLLPLLLVSDPGLGGYNFGPAEVSIVLTTIAVYGTVTKATLTPYIASKISYKTLFMTGLFLYAVGISLLPSMASISGLEAMTSRNVSNQTAHSSDLIQNFTTAECSSTTYPRVMTEGYTQTAAEINATVERPLIGQCRLEGHKRETSQPPVSNPLPWVWGPLLSVVLLMEQGRSFSFLASMVLVGNSGVVSNIPLVKD
ncbi:PREDICTED: probable peptide/nitrate transporter At3g43790 [Branchiostoma belcheri]|uniref:Probable peptide/nitrate transporter At3g43790 n=1 Tax=Branchiostoma belcheri TaxID=7741 RepID=A0A6P4Z286_BRABE|nr:PREDICTED: probable peptide/nitrate transporter At3g43790 [Branchiostoma belcheri]